MTDGVSHRAELGLCCPMAATAEPERLRRNAAALSLGNLLKFTPKKRDNLYFTLNRTMLNDVKMSFVHLMFLTSKTASFSSKFSEM